MEAVDLAEVDSRNAAPVRTPAAEVSGSSIPAAEEGEEAQRPQTGRGACVDPLAGVAVAVVGAAGRGTALGAIGEGRGAASRGAAPTPLPPGWARHLESPAAAPTPVRRLPSPSAAGRALPEAECSTGPDPGLDPGPFPSSEG